MNATTDDFLALDVRWLAREGILHSDSRRIVTWSEGTHPLAEISIWPVDHTLLALSYSTLTDSGDAANQRYQVCFEWTDCNFGGQRPWFRCPAVGCGRRCAILYGRRVFACRRCRDLTYPRCNMSDPFDLARHRLVKAATRLAIEISDGPFVVGPPAPDRPKHMHVKTYFQLLREYEQAQQLLVRTVY